MDKTFTNRILGSNIAVTNEDEAADLIIKQLNKMLGQYILLAKVEDIIFAQKDANYKTFLHDAALALPVGEPIAWVERLRGFELAESIKEEELFRLLTMQLHKQKKTYCYLDMRQLSFTANTENMISYIKAQNASVIWISQESYSGKKIDWATIAKDTEALMLLGHKQMDGSKRIIQNAIQSSWKQSFYANLEFLFRCIPDTFRWRKKDAAEKKDLLIYAHYYYPDVASTGQILTELAEGLNDTFHTTVICTVPSYTGKIDKYYRKHKFYYENINGVDVLRIRVPEFRKNFSPSRIINIVSYFFAAVIATRRVGHQDYVFTISQPPVLGGLLGVLGKWLKHAKLIYNIQDFNPEQVMAVSFTSNPLILNTMMLLDKFSCKQADKIILVGRDMINTLQNRFPKQMPNYAHINNWINEQEIVPLPKENEQVQQFKEKYGIAGKFVIMYSGNIGLYYDLLEIEKIIAAFQDRKEVVFAFVGQGSVLEEMQAYKEQEKLSNIVFIPYQDKKDLVYSLNAGDVHFVVNAKGIKGVSVPSKLYGVMAAGKPVLGILEAGSEARLIVEEADCGLVVEPGEYSAISNVIQYFIDHKSDEKISEMGQNGRVFLEKHLTRSVSIQKYADEILSLK